MIRRSARQQVKVPVLVFVAGLVAITTMPAFGSGSFQKTGSMNVARVGGHTATLLSNGEVAKIPLASLRVLKLGMTYDNNN